MTTHGMYRTSEYQAWAQMKDRCFNPNHKRYSDWGGRGIAVYDRWKNSFENLLADMGSRPTSKHSLDRIDNNADYSPENCHWATKEQQGNNKRNNHLITNAGETLTISQWSKKMNINYHVIHARLNMGWSDVDSVTTPVNPIRLITIEGVTLTIPQWTKKTGFNSTVIQSRLKKGWSEFDAVMIPVRNKNLRRDHEIG